MAFTTYRQQDAPWGSKNYNGSGTVGANGCGPTSCAIVISYLDPSVTPTDTVKYMQKHNYAIRGNGTARAGITACLKAYGFDAKNLNISSSMKPLWDYLANKSVKCGVLLFSKGTRGGVTWTQGGHYVAFTDYKVKKGKHYLYTRDPNKNRRNDGWHCYETMMRGLLPTCFVATPKSATKPVDPVTKPTDKYTGALPKPTLKVGSKGTETKNLQQFLNFYNKEWNLSVDGDFGSATKDALIGFQRTEGIEVDGVYGKDSQAKAKTYIKITESKAEKLAKMAESLAWAYGTPESKWSYKTGSPTAICKTAMQSRGYNNKISYSDCGYFQNTIVYKALGKKVKILAGTKAAFPNVSGFSIVHEGAVTAKSLKRGDIIRYKSTSGQHVLMYLGNGKIAEAGRGIRFGVIRKSAKYNSSYVKKSTVQVLRVEE